MAVKESGTHLEDEIMGILRKYECDIRYWDFRGVSPRRYEAVTKEIVELFKNDKIAGALLAGKSVTVDGITYKSTRIKI